MIKQSRIPAQLCLGALALAIAVATAGSASAAVANATSSGTVVGPLTITKTTDLAFGTFTPAATTGTVTIATNGARTFSGGVVGMAGTTNAAQFDVTGQTGATYTISLTDSGTLTSGTDTMAFTAISALTASAATSGSVTSGTLTGGTQSIYVGGVLDVAANQPVGTYSGTITATVEYN